MDPAMDPAAKLIALCLHARNKIREVILLLKHIAIVFFIRINFLAGKAFTNYSVSGNSYLRLGKPIVNIDNLHIKAT